MKKYETSSGVPCTDKENALINSLKRLSKKWYEDGGDLTLFSASGRLVVLKGYEYEPNTFEDCTVETIYGITNDGGDMR